MRADATEREAQFEKERQDMMAERELISAEKQEKIQLKFELKEQMQGMELLSMEIEKKETWIREEIERVELLAAKLARKEKHLIQEEQRL